ncbi:hypothetical protein PLICRDRAFT_606721 [Plicaturopsis crispa FD-325 SS-3]|nr:hypothetical protein PLICRDRAFT_606721 [Plicaturopsis crispa FD-325 SS-3]
MVVGNSSYCTADSVFSSSRGRFPPRAEGEMNVVIAADENLQYEDEKTRRINDRHSSRICLREETESGPTKSQQRRSTKAELSDRDRPCGCTPSIAAPPVFASVRTPASIGVYPAHLANGLKKNCIYGANVLSEHIYRMGNKYPSPPLSQ